MRDQVIAVDSESRLGQAAWPESGPGGAGRLIDGRPVAGGGDFHNRSVIRKVLVSASRRLMSSPSSLVRARGVPPHTPIPPEAVA